MAILTHQGTGNSVTDPAEIKGTLAKHDLLFEQWDIAKYNGAEAPTTGTVEEHILSVFSTEIAAISEARGYTTADVIALRPDTPNLDAICAKFDKEHTHSEDEVRFVVAGRGVFACRGNDGELYDIELHPGDLLAVPEGKQHYFFLCEDRNIQCIRLFTDPSGWVADYVD